MDKLKNTFKTRYRDMAVTAAGCTAYFFILPAAYALVALLITLVLSLLLLVLTDGEKNGVDKEIASLSFFSEFLFKIDSSLPCRTAYETSVRCLIGYFDLLPYDTVEEDPSSFSTGSGYDVCFREVMEKEKGNEVHLSDCSILSDEAYRESEKLIAKRNSLERGMTVGECIVSFILLALALVFVFIPGTDVLNDSLLYNVLASLVLSLMMPSSLLTTYLGYGRLMHV